MFAVRYGPPAYAFGLERTAITHPRKFTSLVVCGARGPRPRYPRVWKTRKRIGTISKSKKLVECVKDLSNVKEEVYGALDSFVAWELEFPLIAVKKALKLLEDEKEWKRIIQVIKWMFNKGQGKTIGSHYTLLNALIEDGRVEEAEELYEKIFSRYLEGLPRTFFMRMISLYYRLEAYQKMFEIFADMEELGVKPDGSIIRMLGEVFHKLGMFDKYVQLKRKYPPPKWEYRYIKGKRIRIKVYPENKTHGPIRRNPGTDEVEEEEESMNLDSELEEEASAGLDRNVLDEAACGDLEFV
uniref:Pentacotripeptide-repeat region of PRORP domain-containing protein n=1 Tax=Leersia perrieri TaxID=77586 RepID=A0A0D9V5U8_9ORYZ